MDVRLPNLGEGADSGVIVSVFVKEGDTVEKDQTLLELENEKAVAPIPSTAAGKVDKIHVKEGDSVSVGQVLISLSGDGDGGGAEESQEDREPADSAKAQAKEEPDSAGGGESGKKPSADSDKALKPLEPKPGVEPAASPSIRRLARQLGVDLTRVPGSERGGRIVMDDVKDYIIRVQAMAFAEKESGAAEGAPSRPAPEPIDFSQWGSVVRRPLSQLRQTIARRMSESWNAIPHVTQFDEVDVTRLGELRSRYKGAYTKKEARLTLTPMLLKAVVGVLQKHPAFNSSLDESANEVIEKEYFHIGLAVDTEAGLMVPVIRDVDKKSVLELCLEVADLAARTRDRKLSGEEMKGGAFTISNQGGIGGGHFTPIVNRPEVAILGLGRSLNKPVVHDGEIRIRTIMPVAISYDHRVIDGGEAARFAVDLVRAIEEFPEDELKLGGD